MSNPIGCYSKYITARITLGNTPTFSFHLGFPTRWGEHSLQARRGELMLTPTAAVQPTLHYSSCYPNTQQPLVKTSAMAHWKSQGPSLMLPSLQRSCPSLARLSLAAPNWVTCFLSSTISLMRLFHKEKNEIKCQGVGSKEFWCAEVQGQTAGKNEPLDHIGSCWEPMPPLPYLFVTTHL